MYLYTAIINYWYLWQANIIQRKQWRQVKKLCRKRKRLEIKLQKVTHASHKLLLREPVTAKYFLIFRISFRSFCGFFCVIISSICGLPPRIYLPTHGLQTKKSIFHCISQHFVERARETLWVLVNVSSC